MKISMKISGLEKLQKELDSEAKKKIVQSVVKKNGADLQRTMMNNAQFRGHYEPFRMIRGKPTPVGKLVWKDPTGALGQSIALQFLDGGLSAKVGPQVHYAPYVEYGTRFMSAQPYAKPAFDTVSPKFISDLQKALGK